jgi:ferrous iron transport protein B
MKSSVLLVGNPNSGKSFIFNRLTGLKQKVANFPGVTVDIRSGVHKNFLIKDFPGMYSLSPLTQDESVAFKGLRSALEDNKTEGVIYVADATRLERSLYFFLQISRLCASYEVPLIIAVNIVDEVLNKGASIDSEGLSKVLGLPVILVSAKTGFGMALLAKALNDFKRPAATAPKAPGTFALPPALELKIEARNLAKTYGPQVSILLKSQEKLDSFFLSGTWGFLAFFLLMAFLFQSIFTFAAPAMDLVSNSLSALGAWVSSHLPEGMLADFVQQALFDGAASVFVFVPQIFILFFIIGLLEDSGYLARATIICHKPLSFFGLSGKSFVPLLSGHACAIPAIMSTRTIESPKKRLITQLITPFMTCSARLPVYGLLVAAFVPKISYVGGLLGSQGLVFFSLYMLSIVFGLLVATFLNMSLPKKTEDSPFVVELPPYRVPSLKSIFKDSLSRTSKFVSKAGLTIFIVVVSIWALGYFPNGSGHLDTSYMSLMGKWIDPIFSPIGLDWKMGVAILTSFLAREVFVGTLGTLYGLENAADDPGQLIDQLHNSGITIAAALGLMVFYALAMQCVSTLGVLKSETGSKRIPVYVFFGYFLLAYLAATLTFHVASIFS